MLLGNFLKRQEGVYKSIDVRIAAVKSGAVWQNALTVLRFSYEEPAAIQNRHAAIKSKWPELETSNFQIQMQAWAFELLQILCQRWSEGEIIGTSEVGNIQLGRNVDLLGFKGVFRNYAYTRAIRNGRASLP